jgi:hypothetical protein
MSDFIATEVHCEQCAEITLVQRLEAERSQAVEEARVERSERARHQGDAAHYRSEARRLASQMEQLGDALRGALASAKQASEDNPGHAALAARVREAAASYRIYTAITEGQVKA